MKLSPIQIADRYEELKAAQETRQLSDNKKTELAYRRSELAQLALIPYNNERVLECALVIYEIGPEAATALYEKAKSLDIDTIQWPHLRRTYNVNVANLGIALNFLEHDIAAKAARYTVLTAKNRLTEPEALELNKRRRDLNGQGLTPNEKPEELVWRALILRNRPLVIAYLKAYKQKQARKSKWADREFQQKSEKLARCGILCRSPKKLKAALNAMSRAQRRHHQPARNRLKRKKHRSAQPVV